MQVFVTGGTGVLGRAVIRKLTARGHDVVALAHSTSSHEVLTKLGARAVQGSLYDTESLMKATEGADALLHLATRIPPSAQMRKESAWTENSRIRTEGTRNLVDAAIANQVKAFVYPSVVFFYPDNADRWIDASSADAQPTPFLTSTLDAEGEVRRFTEAGGRGVTLRLGWLYGPESSHTLEALQYARRGIAAIAGKPDAYQSWVWDADAAEALVLAMEQAPAGTYDVVDDEPVPRKELVRAMAAGVGRKKLRRLPALMTTMATGKTVAEMAGRSQRVSNSAFKQATGWQPSVRSVHDGWRRLTR